MNFVYLARKYGGVECLCEDRTWDGLIWPVGNGSKPSLQTFQGWQEQEDQQGRLLTLQEREKSLMLESARAAAKQKALEDIVPLRDKLRSAHESAYQEALSLRQKAIELEEAMRVKGEVDGAWREISKAQDLINQEAQKYLDDTAFVLSWDHTDVPAEIATKRAEARRRIDLGKTVYANWLSFRSKEMPSSQEIHEAIQKGGEHLERIKEIARQAALRYPKPRVY